MLIAAKLPITKSCKETTCPSIDEWIKQMCDLHTVDFYSATRENTLELFFRNVDAP